MSRVKHLQQRLKDLRERERLAKVHNRELLQQFDEAQNTLREVLNHTAAMKMLRKEYMCNIGSCSHWHQLDHKTQRAKEKICGERQQNNLKTDQLSHPHGRGTMSSKTAAYQGLFIVPELQAQTLTPKISNKLSHSPSSFLHDPVRPHLFPSRPSQEHHFTHYYDPSHTISPNELHTDQLTPWPPQTETMPKQPPSCSSETSEEDSSQSEDLDEKPVRLSTDQEGSKESSCAASQGSTRKGKSNQSSSSDEDLVISQSSPSRELSIGSNAMELISENEDAKTSSNKTKHKNGIGFKDTKNKDDSTEDCSQSDKSDVENSSVNLSQSAQEEPQGSRQLKKIPTIKEKEQSLLYQSSLEDEDDSEKEIDENGKETSQEDGEMSNQEIPVCSPGEEGDHKTLISGSTSSSFESKESASSECEGDKDNMKVCEPQQDTALGSEDSDSEDCIVSPQTRSKIIYVTTENVVKHQDEESNSKSTSDDEDSNSSSDEEDIEHVLAPPAQTQKQRKPKDDKTKEPCESDDFYD